MFEQSKQLIMNQMKNLLTLLSLGALLTFVSCDKEKVVPASEFPNEIEAFVSNHFPSNKIIQVIEDQDGITKTYDVILDGNVNLEFNRDMEIIDIDAQEKLPNTVIPAKINEYMAQNFPNNFITDWKIDDNQQEIKLDNGLEIKFNKNDELIKIDN